MSSFTKFQSFVRVASSRTDYALCEKLVWDIGAQGSGWQLIMTTGFRFNISVPHLLEWLLSPHNRQILPAAAIHDELLNRGHDKAFASSEFRRACIARGVHPAFAWVLFFATLIKTAFFYRR
ncbi:MAG: DUF1353 domain-containing protein [Robiginitomaculum sp.]|nr:DUF1353 domain-containing protein [Robiginitomaculum sp.]